MHQQNRAFNRCASFGKFLLGTVANIDEFRFQSARGRRRRKPFGNERDRKLHRAQHLQPRCAFTPCYRQRVFFGVHVHAGGAKCGHAPLHGFRHFCGAADTSANFVSEFAKVFLQRRVAHHDRHDFRRCLCACGAFRCGARRRAGRALRRAQDVCICRWQLRESAKDEEQLCNGEEHAASMKVAHQDSFS